MERLKGLGNENPEDVSSSLQAARVHHSLQAWWEEKEEAFRAEDIAPIFPSFAELILPRNLKYISEHQPSVWMMVKLDHSFIEGTNLE